MVLKCTYPFSVYLFNLCYEPSHHSLCVIGRMWGRFWSLTNLTVCPDEFISHNSDKWGYQTTSMDDATWRLCKQETILKACVSYDGMNLALCQVKNATLILSVFWAAFAASAILLGCTYCFARYRASKYALLQINSMMSLLLASVRRNWNRALKWKPYGVKLGALLGLAVFWFDKASDVKLLAELGLDSYMSFALLALLIF